MVRRFESLAQYCTSRTIYTSVGWFNRFSLSSLHQHVVFLSFLSVWVLILQVRLIGTYFYLDVFRIAFLGFPTSSFSLTYFSLTPEIVSTPSSPEEEDKSILDAAVLIDNAVPTTKIQIRLADGSRLIQRFNQTHR